MATKVIVKENSNIENALKDFRRKLQRRSINRRYNHQFRKKDLFRRLIFLGKALIKYENGASYEGHIEGDLKCHGFGIIRYPLGAKYIGNIIRITNA